MASPVASSSNTFAFLNTSGGLSSDSYRARETASGSFSDMLRGQINGKNSGFANTPSRPTTPDSESSRTPDRSAQAPERQRERPAEAATGNQSERKSADRPANESSPRAERTQATDKADRAHTADRPTEQGSSETDPEVAEDAAKPAAESAAAETPTDPAAMPLAGLPAAIAALLPGLAAKSAPTGTTADVSTGDPSDAEHVDLAARIGLTGDTGNKSLQNSDVLKQKALPSAGQTAAQAAGTTLLQAKPELTSGFGERLAAALQASPGEPGAGMQGAALHTLRHTNPLQPAPPQLPVATPAGQRGWAEEVGNRVMWMIGRAESKAELVLTPPNLGKVEVSINLNGDQTTAQFVAASQAARDALEQAMPRLREMLAQSGISLGQAGVNTSDGQQASGNGSGRNGERGNGTAGAGTSEADSVSQWVRQTDGLVDTFA